MTFGSAMSRLSGFACCDCGAPLRYFAVLATADGGSGDAGSEAVTCDVCQARMRLGDRQGGSRLARFFIGLLPEAAAMTAILVSLQWLLQTDGVAALTVAGSIASTIAVFFPLILMFAVLENRFNHRVMPGEPLYDGQDDAKSEVL